MKKLFLSINLVLIVANLGYFVFKNHDFTSIHAVSESSAKNESGSGEELVSLAYAVVPVQQKETDLKKLFPNLKISGEINEERMKLIRKVLLMMPQDKLQNFYVLQITQKKGETRGLGGTNTVIINDYNLSDQEFIAVLVHEIGHVIDLGGIQGNPVASKSVFHDGGNPIFKNDFSTVYYAYSWKDNYEHSQSANRLDFVSGYAMTDPFEDFAESFVYYVLHNMEFKMMAKENEKLDLKYAYIRDYIFNGIELQSGLGTTNIQKRVWDATKLAIKI